MLSIYLPSSSTRQLQLRALCSRITWAKSTSEAGGRELNFRECCSCLPSTHKRNALIVGTVTILECATCRARMSVKLRLSKHKLSVTSLLRTVCQYIVEVSVYLPSHTFRTANVQLLVLGGTLWVHTYAHGTLLLTSNPQHEVH